jgi:hypothetical protein
MPVDLSAAARFVANAARLLDRHRYAALIDGGPRPPVLAALGAYRNDDGGFGHALEPDLRVPASQPGPTLYALEMLAEMDALDDPMAAAAIEWVAGIAATDGSIPSVVGDIDAWPHAPWWQPEDGTFLTAGIACVLHQGGVRTEWRDGATGWCWEQLRIRETDSRYWWLYCVGFLDHVGDRDRAEAELERIREPVGALMSTPSEEGDPGALACSPWPWLASRSLFAPGVIERELDALEDGQGDDGGWSFGWPAWSPGATLDWRGWLTVRALLVLRGNGRL